MIDQIKIGSFLKMLRREKGKTQEEIAEMLGVSSRSVSRWENGTTMPDLGMLVELADYYDTDIREIIDGERRAEPVNEEFKQTLLKVADYAEKDKKQTVNRKRIVIAVLSGLVVLLIAALIALPFLQIFFEQYNTRGISNIMSIYIDESQERTYIGELEGHQIYTDRMRAEELYFLSYNDDRIPLSDALSGSLTSIGDWRRGAWRIDYDGDTEVLVFESYEIDITADECVIRPLTGRAAPTTWEGFINSIEYWTHLGKRR